MVTITMCALCSCTWISMWHVPPGSLRHSCRDDHYFAIDLAVCQQAHRFTAALQRQTVGNTRGKLPLLIPLAQLGDRRAQFVRRVPAKIAQRASQGRTMLDQQSVRRNARDTPHKTDE